MTLQAPFGPTRELDASAKCFTFDFLLATNQSQELSTAAGKLRLEPAQLKPLSSCATQEQGENRFLSTAAADDKQSDNFYCVDASLPVAKSAALICAQTPSPTQSGSQPDKRLTLQDDVWTLVGFQVAATSDSEAGDGFRQTLLFDKLAAKAHWLSALTGELRIFELSIERP